MNPLSDDPEKRARQLANLRPGAGAWKPGSAPQLRHGLRTRKPPPEVIDPVLDRVLDDLEARVPIKGSDGEVPPWLRELAWSAAIKKLQIVRCARFLAQNGETDERGNYRRENELLTKATDAYERSLERLAMTVDRYLKAGLDLARGIDLASAMSEPDPDRRAELLRQAGIDEGDDG
jgi:hypothetical protein